MDALDAKSIMGRNFIGYDELRSMAEKLGISVPMESDTIPAVPYTAATLKAAKDSHILILGVSGAIDGKPLTLNRMRDFFGVDPAVKEPCFYNQDWYLKEAFASRETPGDRWHLLRKDVLDSARSRRPEEIESALSGNERFPSAVTCAFVFFAYYFHSAGGVLWKNDFLWCSDRDHNGDIVYVGRYEDPQGVNKNGFNVHRHLALRPVHSVAPEISS